ncbi:hypothetical protein ABZT08_29735 [Streptomyces sp. NPDC005526]|uniref:hypothetical protein n=1 Tax=Streptomyces sp. NPDC005526 TaxID=3156885 RepID=UPI0033BEBAB3
MPADEVTHGTDVDESRVRTGPRHAAPRKPLFTRFHMPAGKAIAMAAMPTAVLMGMGFTSTLAVADGNSTSPSSANSLTADEYKNCVAALDSKDKASASPSPSASASSTGSTGGKDGSAEPAPSATSGSSGSSSGSSSSPDSGSGEKATPQPSATTSDSGSGSSGGGTASPSPSASTSGDGGLLGGIGDTIGDIFTGGSSTDSASGTSTATPSATASPSASATKDSSSGTSLTDTVKDTTGKVTGTVENTVKNTTDTASKAAQDVTGTVKDTAGAATAAADPSASSTTDPSNCPAATDAQGGVDNKVPLADDPWYLDASSLTLKGADYKGVVEVRTANGTVKKVLKYVISDGTDIGDLHQTVKDKQSGKTYHVQAAKGSKSTITGGDTVMYTESISGNLLGLIPVTFDPDNPPPLNIPLIYFTKVKVVQAAQFGGNLHVPGMHLYTTD